MSQAENPDTAPQQDVQRLRSELEEHRRTEERALQLSHLREQLLAPLGLDEKLKLITDTVVAVLGADFARVWMVRKGDLCDSGCGHAAVTEGPHVCRNRSQCLHLMASSGRYTRVDGTHRRVPLGCYKIGRIASGDDASFLTNDVVNDPRVHDPEWARALGLRSFAGHRLVDGSGRPVGVLALFSKRSLSAAEQELLTDFARTTSHLLLAAVATECLHESESRYRTLFDQSPISIWEEDFSAVKAEFNRLCAEGVKDFRAWFRAHPEAVRRCAAAVKILNMNQETLHVFGASRLDDIPTHLPTYFDDESYCVFGEELACLAEGGRRFESEIPIRDLQGGRRVLSLQLMVPPAYSQTLTRVLVTFSDITERKRAEEAVRESNDRFHALFDNMTAGVVIVGESDRFLLANRAMQRMLGYTLEEMRGLTPADITAPGDEVRSPPQVFSMVQAGQDVYRLEKRYRRKDGSVFWADACISPLGTSGQAIGVTVDITERKQAGEALRESEERHRATLASIPDLVFVLDREGRFVEYHAPEGGGLYQPPKVFLGKLFGEALPPAIAEPLAKAIDIIKHGAPVQRLDYEMEVQGERTFWSANISPRRDNTGRFDGVTILTRDMTERMRMQERLRQAEKLTAIGELAGGIAHDFNNQLAGVMGYADILADRLEDGDLKRYAQNIVVSARRAADLTQKLLAFGRKGKYLSVPVAVHQLLGEVVTILERSIDKRIRISQLLKAGQSVIMGDPSQLQNAILNVALNARDAMPQGGELTFETDLSTLDEEHCRNSPYEIIPGQYLRLSITDTGCGMTDEVKKHLFEPFFTTKKPGQGTGMGLASVYGAVRNHRGAISVYSEVGHGTTFHIHLPLAPDAAKPAERGPESAPARGAAKILVVDDEKTIRELASEMLRRLGYSVATYADGREAVEYYRANWRQVDLVILDMVMPEMGARDAFIAMRQINPQIRALLSSGYALNGEAQGILDEGVLAFVGKPYCQAELSQSVAQALARK